MRERAGRTVRLRAEETGADRRYLDAWVDANGNLHLEGQDLGPGTAMVSSSGEYEWFETVSAEHLPALVSLLGGQPGTPVLDVLEERYVGRAGNFETLLRDSGIPVERFVWSSGF